MRLTCTLNFIYVAVIKTYLKITFRNIWRNKRINVINIFGLSIGLAVAVLIMLLVQNELSYDSFHDEASNIYRVKTKLFVSKSETLEWETSPYLLGEYAKKEIPGIKNATRLRTVGRNNLIVRYANHLFSEKNCAFVDNQWFIFFNYLLISGSIDDFNHKPFSIIMTESTALKYFGKGEAVGKTLLINRVNYQVQAIIKNNPSNSSFQYDILIPIASKLSIAKERNEVTNWDNLQYLTFFKLEPNTNVKNVAIKLSDISHRYRANDKTNYSLVKLKDMHFETGISDSSIEHGNIRILNIFGIIAIMLLMTACINYVNLTTAKASIRSKEVSIRKIIGASRKTLLAQFLFESLVTSFISLLIAICIIILALPWFKEITDKQFINPFASLSIWFIMLGTLFISFLANGIYPALLLSSFQPLNVFKGKNILNIKDGNLRKGLVIIQFSISVILIISSTIIFQQLRYIENTDLGYDKSHVFTVSIPFSDLSIDEEKNKFFLSTLKIALLSESSIEDASVTSSRSIYNNTASMSGFINWSGRPGNFNPEVATLSADENFCHLMKIKLKEGRWFTSQKSDRHNFILNETAVTLFNIHKPVIGQSLVFDSDTGKIIGVTKDFHYKSLYDKIGPMVINSHIQFGPTFYIKSSPSNVKAAVSACQKIWSKYILDAPMELNFVDEGYNHLYHSEQRYLSLTTIFSIIAIVISMLGILGLIAFSAEQKVKEIGIRKVLGASNFSVLKVLSVDFIGMVITAILIAFPISWLAMNYWLSEFAYKIKLSVWPFLFAVTIVLLITILIIGLQAIKSALANPVKALRSER